MLELHELKSGVRVRGLVAAGEVTVVAVESATIQPLPHRIDAVYGRLMPSRRDEATR